MTQIIMYDQSIIHVDGYRNIVRFNPDQILLGCRKNQLLIEGRNLRISSFDDTEITIAGCIFDIKWMSGGRMEYA